MSGGVSAHSILLTLTPTTIRHYLRRQDSQSLSHRKEGTPPLLKRLPNCMGGEGHAGALIYSEPSPAQLKTPPVFRLWRKHTSAGKTASRESLSVYALFAAPLGQLAGCCIKKDAGLYRPLISPNRLYLCSYGRWLPRGPFKKTNKHLILSILAWVQ